MFYTRIGFWIAIISCPDIEFKSSKFISMRHPNRLVPIQNPVRIKFKPYSPHNYNKHACICSYAHPNIKNYLIQIGF